MTAPEAREVAQQVINAWPWRKRRDGAGLRDAITAALDAYAAPLREEIEARRADAVIKVANARREAFEAAAKIAEAAHANAQRIKIETLKLQSAGAYFEASCQMKDALSIAADIRALTQEDGNG